MLISEEAGCKVAWAYYDNEDEARARGREEDKHRDRQLARGYDFGYQWPGSGSVEHVNHVKHGPCWKVVCA